MRNAKVGRDSLFSKEVLYTLFLTNILSILLGAGVGYENT
jgi:BCL2/adenovirus E1B protein-interacting protein 3